VREVVVRRRSDVEAEWVSESLVFDPAGCLMTRRRATPSSADGAGLQVSVAAADGTAVEEEVVGGVDAWETWRVPNVAFGCTGATLARTFRDREGRPSRTTFSDAGGRVLSRIDYATDSQGLISVARQTVGIGGSGSDIGEEDEIELGLVTLAYAEGGRPVREAVRVLGTERTVYEWKYSDDGVMVTMTAAVQGRVTATVFCTYADFDVRGNWRRSVIEAGDRRGETYREIYYRPD
jgi:hypothetical protein